MTVRNVGIGGAVAQAKLPHDRSHRFAVSPFHCSTRVRKPASRLDRALYVKRPLDLVIRTGNQHRLSNFMLYQASYAEIYFCDKMWPEFTRKDFEKILKWYHEQQRKFGK